MFVVESGICVFDTLTSLCVHVNACSARTGMMAGCDEESEQVRSSLMKAPVGKSATTNRHKQGSEVCKSVSKTVILSLYDKCMDSLVVRGKHAFRAIRSSRNGDGGRGGSRGQQTATNQTNQGEGGDGHTHMRGSWSRA